MVKRTGEFLPLLRDLVPDSTSALLRRTPSQELHAAANRRYVRDLRDARNGFVTVSLITLTIWIGTSISSGGVYLFWPIFSMIGVGIGYVSIALNRETRTADIWEKLVERPRREIGVDDA